MAQKRRARDSTPPPSPNLEKRWAAVRKIFVIMNKALREVEKNEAAAKRSMRVAGLIVQLLNRTGMHEKLTAEDAKVLLAARTVGLMQSLGTRERDKFLRKLRRTTWGPIENSFSNLFKGEEIGKDGVPIKLSKPEATKLLTSYTLEAGGEFFDQFRRLVASDMASKKPEDYKKLYSDGVISGEIHRAMVYARAADLTVAPFKKIEILAGKGVIFEDHKLLELSETAIQLWTRIADTAGFGIGVATKIREQGTELFDIVMEKRGTVNGDSKLYWECKAFIKEMAPAKDEIVEELITKRGLHRIIADVGMRFNLDIELASQTSDPKQIWRPKDGAGTYLKIKRKRAKGLDEFGVEKMNDLVAITAEVAHRGGGTDFRRDVVAAAEWVRLELEHKYKIGGARIKSGRRPSGYQGAHLDFRMNGVPVEIQFRSREMNDMAKTGKYAHGAKETGFITHELIDALRPDWKATERFHKNKSKKIVKGEGAKSQMHSYTVVLYTEDSISMKMDVKARKGEIVGGIVALTAGVGRAVQVKEGNGKQENGGKTLGLFEQCPETIIIYEGAGKKLTLNTWRRIAAQVLTEEAKETINTEVQHLKKKGKARNNGGNGRKGGKR